MTLAELAIYERELIHAYLGGLLAQPFHALVHLGRRHGYMQVSQPSPCLRQLLHHSILAAVARLSRNLGTQEQALSIHQIKLVAHAQTQHAQGMPGLFGRQFGAVKRIGHIEIPYFLHLSVISFHGLHRLGLMLVTEHDGKCYGHHERITCKDIPAGVPSLPH